MPPPNTTFARAASVHLALRDLLKEPASTLLGVSAAAAEALEGLGIKSVFDLGAANVFALARAAASAGAPGQLASHYGMAPGDWLQPSATYTSLEDIAGLSIEHLRGLSVAQATTLKQALDVSTIGELANWPPHTIARQLLESSIGNDVDAETLQAEALRPRFGEYPTERVYYTTLVMLDVPSTGATLTEIAGPLNINDAVTAGTGFETPAVGAMVTLAQSWYAQGITLGQMIHSLALAPGEATRIAMIDWTRSTLARANELISEADALTHTTAHQRAISEVQTAVAQEMQSGGSRSYSQGTTLAGGTSTGLSMMVPIYGAILGGTSGLAVEGGRTSSEASSSAWSLGTKSVTATMAQDVNDRTEQHSTLVRNRRASAVREVSQTEHEEISTRIVANYNHMHALTVQYYEVVQVYRLETEVQRADRVLFLPIQSVDFSDDAVLASFRHALAQAALTSRAADLLTDETTTVEIKPAVNFNSALLNDTFATLLLPVATAATLAAAPPATPPTESPATVPASATPRRRVNVSAAAFLATNDAVASASRILSRPVTRPGSTSLFYPDETELVGLQIENVVVASASVNTTAAGGANIRVTPPEGGGTVELGTAIRLGDVSDISLQKADTATGSGLLHLHLSFRGRRFSSPPIPVSLAAGPAGASVAVLRFHSDMSDRRAELKAHLNANRAHYSAAAYRSLGSAAVVGFLSKYTWRGRRLIDVVEPKVLTVAGNFIVLRAPVNDDEAAGVTVIEGNPPSWADLLEDRDLTPGRTTDSRLVPVPTEGVFAEAVLGRSNSAEKLDMTRFWNWQDSPAPLTPPELAPIAAGSRGAAETLAPGQLTPSTLNIVNPTTFPDPAGVGAALGSLGTLGFRDMSGLAGTQRMGESALTGSATAASDVGRHAVEMGQISADIVKAAISAGQATKTQSGGISADGARVNLGRDIDKRSEERTAGDAAAPDPSTPSSSSTPSTEPGVSAEAPTYSRERAYADAAALGYSPDAVAETRLPTTTYIPPAVFASYGAGGPLSYILQRLKHVTTVIGFFVTKPVKVFVNYHKIHFAVLGQVLDAVQHAKAIQAPARRFAGNIADFAQECDRVKFEALKIPVDPFEDSPEPYEQVRALRDPKVAQAMSRYLLAYRDAVQRALAAAQSCQDVRDRIDTESQPLLQQLNAALDAFPQANTADAVAKLAAMQDVDFMKLRMSTLLPQAERAIDATLAHLAVAKENIDAIMQ